MRWIVLILLVGILTVGAACSDDSGNGGDATPTVIEVEATETEPPAPTNTQPPPATDTPVPPEPTVPPAPQPQEQEPPPQQPQPQTNCHPSYTGACLDPNASDYDCAGGSGNGPLYTGRVNVVGPDVFDLDSDGDGVGCE